jgi:nicotinamidase-related amidase
MDFIRGGDIMILLIVDTQKGITDGRLFAFEKLRANIKTLIRQARKHRVEVVYMRHDDGPGTGFSVGDNEFAIFEEFAPLKGERIFDKTVNSALHESTGLAEYLSKKKETKIMIVGLQTNFCIDATIQSGFHLGYEMIVPAYANSTFDNDYMTKNVCYHYYNDFLWNGRYARCVSMEEAVEMLAEKE